MSSSFSIARRSLLKLLGATGLVACTTDEAADDASESDVTGETFEYIVVGSGAGGGPLAANLARQGHKVLLIEAGDDRGANADYQVPAWHTLSTEDEDMRWDFFVKHYEGAAQQAKDTKLSFDDAARSKPKGVLYPRAGTLGGCTSHNAMITVYPHESDWNGIAELTGDDSWRAESMRGYFQILERAEYLGTSDSTAGHGLRGWLSVNRADPRLGLQDVKILKIVTAAAVSFVRSTGRSIFTRLFADANELLSVMRRDVNTAAPGRDQAEGLYTIPLATTSTGKRNGTREYILSTIDKRAPLTLKTNTLVSRVLFATKKDSKGRAKAIGVEVLEGAHLYRADPKASGAGVKKTYKASREVILSAGAFNTPQILKLSGVGPREELDRFGIPLVVDLPGVGTNLQDRYEVGVVSKLDSDFTLLERCTWGQGSDPCLDDWKRGGGVYTSNGAVVAIVKKSTPDKRDPDLIVFGLPGYFKGYEPGYSKRVTADKRHFTWAVLKAHTGNTAGTVTLRSKDPRDVPDISFRYFDEGTPGAAAADVDAVARGVELARSIGDETRSLFFPFLGGYEEIVPGPSVVGREAIKSFVKNEAWGHHASCTCPIGKDGDPKAVLDSRFKVRGTANLRVVDASVFPAIPGFFIVVPIYMVSEKATDVILEDIGERRSFS